MTEGEAAQQIEGYGGEADAGREPAQHPQQKDDAAQFQEEEG